MSPPDSRSEILAHLRSQIKNGQPVVGAGAGTGLSAKFIEAGGADLIIIYNSGRFRMGATSAAGIVPPWWNGTSTATADITITSDGYPASTITTTPVPQYYPPRLRRHGRGNF